MIVILGGNGFIGSNLVKKLIEEGNSVTVLDNFMSGYRSNLDQFPAVRIVEGDVRDQTALIYNFKSKV